MLLIPMLPIPPTVSAQDGLYAPSRPEDAALVRVANLSGRKESRVIDAGPVRFDPLDPLSVGAYRVVPVGVYILGDPESTVFTPEPGAFVTIITGHDQSDPGRVHLFLDQPHEDPARAQLVLYNLTDRTLSLVDAPSGAEVFRQVPPEQSRALAVNAIPVELEVRDEETIHETVTLRLTRGDSFSLVATIQDDEVVVVAAEAAVQTD